METLPGLGGSVSTEWDILAQYQQPDLPIPEQTEDLPGLEEA